MQLAHVFDNGWKLVGILPSEESPMINHLRGEIATDNENKIFYMHDIFIIMYGLESIIKTCNTYFNK